MKFMLIVLRLFIVLSIGSLLLLYRPVKAKDSITVVFNYVPEKKEKSKKSKKDKALKKAAYTAERYLHEFKMLRNPITGRIPADFREKELNAARRIPSRIKETSPWLSDIMGTEDATVQNDYTSIGPNNVAGRSRTLAFDRRNPDILITGGTTGGIFRSTDGGATWAFVSPENDIRSVNTIVQSPVEPNVWYCGTGEVYYPTSVADIAGTFGFGIFKSTDNGVTWSKLPSTLSGSEHRRFDNDFDLVHKLAVHPVTGHIYAAIHNRIVRSTNGGQTWQTVLSGNNSNRRALGGLTEIIIPANGSRIYAAFTGENTDRRIVGVWESVNGDPQTTNNNAWKRIAGGQAGQADSVSEWQPYGRWGRTVLAMNSNSNQLFVLYKNGKDADQGEPEADLFRADITIGNPTNYAWSNLSTYVPDEPNYDESGIDPYTTQFNGFNMSLAVKPDNDEILFIGGTNLHRVHLNEANAARKFRRAGGYGRGFFPGAYFYPDHHPDVHGIYYAPGNNNTLFTADDGGIHRSSSSDMADTVRWAPHANELQTMQYQFVNIIPDPEFDWMIGGAQDNGTYYNLDVPERSHQPIGPGGDGAACAISNFSKNGNTWHQHWYYSNSNGAIYRTSFTWQHNPTTNELTSTGNTSPTEITPSGLSGSGQWLTLFLNDPDSSEHLYYTNRNRLFRAKSASTVSSAINANNWIEMNGVGLTVPSGHDFSAIAASKLPRAAKYLFLGTDDGRVYRLDSADKANSSQVPVNITPSQMVNDSYVAGIAVNPRNPDTVLMVVSNYDDGANNIPNIFFSGNATSQNPTWQILDGALAPLSSQSCAIVVKTTSVEFYIGTSVGLYSTTFANGNNTLWLKEGSGLMKTAIIRSLVNRPEDNAMLAGTHGNGAFWADIGNPAINGGGVMPPAMNGNNFIIALHPTYTSSFVRYWVGNLPVTKITVQLFNAGGQQVYREERAYQDNIVDMARFADGMYFLRITSSDAKEKFVQRIMKY